MPEAARISKPIEAAFADAIADAGLPPPRNIVADGKPHRFPTNGRAGDTAGWYILFGDHPVTGLFGCWRSGASHKWSAIDQRSLSPTEREHLRHRLEQAKARADADRQERHASAANRAASIWRQAGPAAADHPYLNKKNVQPHGLKQDADSLLVPLYIRGQITSLQTISPDGQKRFMRDGEVKGGLFWIDGAADAPVVIVEGFATGASVSEATGWPVVVAFNAGNLEPVATAIRAKYPDAEIIIGADNDQSGIGQSKAQAAADAVGGTVVVSPDVGTDWNDFAGMHGLEAVAENFQTARQAGAAQQIGGINRPIGTNGTIGKGSIEPDMSVLNEYRRSAPLLPLDVFGPAADWIETTAESKSAPPDYVAGSLLAGAASIIGNARWVKPWGNWAEPSAIWIALVGKPSSGKSPAMDSSILMQRSLEADLASTYDDDLRRYETDVETAKLANDEWQKNVKTAVEIDQPAPIKPAVAVEPDKPVRPRLMVSDVTPEALAAIMAGQPRGVLMHRDELSGWLGNFDRYGGKAGGERGFWIEAYGGRVYILDRVKNDRPIRIPHLTVSILGGIQPDRLASLLMSGDDDGLASRFLMTWPEPVPLSRPTAEVSDAVAMSAMRRLHSLQMVPGENGHLEPVILPLTDEAVDLFHQWRVDHAAATEFATGMLAGHYGKMPGMLLRLALVIEHLWWAWADEPAAPQSISNHAVAAAALLLNDYFKPMAERAYGDAAIPDADRLAATLARHLIIERPEVINSRQIRREAGLPGLKDAHAVRTAISSLEEAGWLIESRSREGGGPGRQREDYVVNPAIWERSP